MKKILLLSLVIIVNFSSSFSQPLKYPVTKKVDQQDNYFGTTVNDPYRWLEDDRSAETAAWVEEENNVTFDYLSKIPFREKVKSRMTQLWNYARYSPPFKTGPNYFYFKNDGIQNQSVMYIMRDLNSEPGVFIDPNLLSADGTTSLAFTTISNDGKYFAYGLSMGGSDWNVIHARNIANEREYEEVLQWVKFSGAAWYKDGFFLWAL